MGDILSQIVETKKTEVAQLLARESIEALHQKALAADAPRDFVGAIAKRVRDNRAAIIAEIKRASPSKGVIRADFDAAAIAKSFEAGGAACLSVLTDRQYFQGGIEYLVAARAACLLPVLRKDFIIDATQIYEARAIGSDAILLIAAILSDDQMAAFEALAIELGMAVLVEAHDETELVRALRLKTPLIGINNRDLRNFDVDLDRTLVLKDLVPADRLVICESGIETRGDLERMMRSGVSGFLIGEAFMRTDKVSSNLSDWAAER